MSEQPASSSSFVKAFIPGLIVGFVVGAAVGVIVASTGGNISKLSSSNKPIERSASTDTNRDGYPDEIIDDTKDTSEEVIEDVEGEVDDLKENIENQIPGTQGGG